MRLGLLATVALCACSAAAHADSFKLFNVNGTFADGSSLTGTINVDLDDTLANGAFKVFDSIGDLKLVRGTETYSFTGTDDEYDNGRGDAGLGFSDGRGDSLHVFFYLANSTSLAGLQGGPLEQITGFQLGSDPIVDLTSGTITPAAAPEPSSFALLGTGLLSIIGAVRRQRA